MRSLSLFLLMLLCWWPGAALAIINGKPADGSEPWARSVAGIGRKADDGYHIFCTASLLGPDVAVTAAHCLFNRDGEMYVVFGLTGKAPAAQGRRVTRKAVHERWVPAHRNDDVDRADIALARFEGGSPEGYRPLPLLADEDALRDGAMVILAGYGLSNEAEAKGAGTLRYTSVPLRHADYAATEAETDERWSGSCAVDSGGPALIEAGGVLYLWGATSHGGGAGCTGSGIYTKIGSYRDWIARTLGSWNAARLSDAVDGPKLRRSVGEALRRGAAGLGAEGPRLGVARP